MTNKLSAYVLTHHWLPNFGANLQALATRRALAARGYDAVFVDLRPPELVEKYARTVPADQQAAHAAFVAEHLPLTRRVSSQDEFLALVREAPADLYLTGSDAVLRVSARSQRSDLLFPNPYWLVGVVGRDGRRPYRIALAPSAMGTRFREMSVADQDGMRTALEAMNVLSARDRWTEGQMRSIGVRRPIAIVPDPVFSLAPVIRELRARSQPARPYIAICTQARRGTRWVEALTRLADREGYDTLALPTPEGLLDEGVTQQCPLPMSPMEWLEALAGSSGYVGGRFHPVVVSLIAGVPVVALDAYHAHPFNRRRSKTWLLMREFGIAGACYGARLHRLLSPGGVWRQLEQQRRYHETQRQIAEAFTGAFADFLDQALPLQPKARTA